MNGGERDELLTALQLVQLRDSRPQTAVAGLGIIRSVGNGDAEYSSWDKLGLTVEEVKKLDDDKLDAVADKLGIEKAAGRSKADVFVNDVGISLKSTRQAPAAIVNHTTRPGWERACREMSVSIDTLDDIMDEYWELRLAGAINQDIHNSAPNSPFAPHQKYMSPILEYFIFRGSGSGPSKYPASLVLDFERPFDVEGWKIYKPKELVADLWSKLVFSVRGKKGMPENFPYVYDTETCDSIARWTYFWQGEYRGALHVRIQ